MHKQIAFVSKADTQPHSLYALPDWSMANANANSNANEHGAGVVSHFTVSMRSSKCTWCVCVLCKSV